MSNKCDPSGHPFRCTKFNTGERTALAPTAKILQNIDLFQFLMIYCNKRKAILTKLSIPRSLIVT